MFDKDGCPTEEALETRSKAEKHNWIMPLVRIMWLNLSQDEKEEVTMTIQKCLDDTLDELLQPQQVIRKEIGLTKHGRVK